MGVALVHVAIFLQAIFGAFSDNTSVKLAGWIVIAGVCFGLFAFVVPTLHALRFFSSCSLFLSLIYTCIAIGVSFSDGNILFLPLSLSQSLWACFMYSWQGFFASVFEVSQLNGLVS